MYYKIYIKLNDWLKNKYTDLKFTMRKVESVIINPKFFQFFKVCLERNNINPFLESFQLNHPLYDI